MNLLLLTQIYPEPDDRNGYKPTKTVEYFAKEWVKAGHCVLVVHCQTKFPFLYYLVPVKLSNAIFRNTYALIPTLSSRKKLLREEYGVKICRLPIKKYIPSTPFSRKEMNKQVRKIINLCSDQNFQPDIVMGHFVNPCFELTSRVGTELNVKTSFVFHHECSKEYVDNYRLKEYLRGIDIIGCRSILLSKSIKKVFDLPYDPFICYSGVPNKAVESADRECKKHSTNSGVVEFLYVGGLMAKKHVDTIIRSFFAVYQDGYHLTIVGGGAEEDFLKRLVKGKGIENAVTFTGRLPRDQVALKMREANIFAMVSEKEAFGMVYLEAMLQGCIVVASVGGGFDGIINEGKNGFLSPEGNEEKLTKVFDTILKMPRAQWNQIGQAAIDTAVNFSEKAVAENYLKNVSQTLIKNITSE
jgi:glycosyltransferase involved in cell wall biosynthesis